MQKRKFEESRLIDDDSQGSIIRKIIDRNKFVLIARLINSLDYNTFISFILLGGIRGEHLIALCSSSRKLNEYANRKMIFTGRDGRKFVGIEEQYLFKLLLDRIGIKVSFGKTPRQTYIDRIIGGRVIGYNYVQEIGAERKMLSPPKLILGLKNIVQVGAGLNYSICLDNQGRVWGFGDNSHGQLGSGGRLYYSSPELNPYLKDIVQVSCGRDFSLCLNKRGRVWGFGKNDKLGIGRDDGRDDRCYPVMISSLENIIQISSSDYHSLCLDKQRRVWVFGNGLCGALGLGDNITKYIPVLNPYLENIVQVSAGGYYSLCLDKNGRVWVFGFNGTGQLGLGDKNDRSVPILNPYLDKIVQVSASATYSVCLNSDGHVFCFGSNWRGHLGLGDRKERLTPSINLYLNGIIQITCSDSGTCFLDYNRNVWISGTDYINQSGLTDHKDGNKYIPVQNPKLKSISQVSCNVNNVVCIEL